MRILIVAMVVLAGILLLLDGSWIVGLVLLAFGVAIADSGGQANRPGDYRDEAVDSNTGDDDHGWGDDAGGDD